MKRIETLSLPQGSAVAPQSVNQLREKRLIAGVSSAGRARIQFTLSCQTRLVYQLNPSWTAARWAAQLAKMRPAYLKRMDVNHRHGFATPTEIREALERLKRCAEKLGFTLQQIDRSNWQIALNQLHIEFPEFFKKPRTQDERQLAHEMNLLIHWLEYELPNYFGGKQQYIFNLDFNHLPAAYDLKEEFRAHEFKFFSPTLEFGSLHLHYIYIGRHFLEMFDADDMQSPQQHFRAQHEFNATCGLSFSEPIDENLLKRYMLEYYNRRGGAAFFGYEFDDPKLAVGFFKLGQLENINDYASFEQRQKLRAQIKN